MKNSIFNRAPTGSASVAGDLNGNATATDVPGVLPFTPTRTIALGGRWLVPRKDEVLVVPVGGVGRIGMNWTLYGTDGRWILVDAGLCFPDADTEDVEAIMPDPGFLKPIFDRLEALVVTHAHEDHIGSIHRLWPGSISCPIYATPFAAGVLVRRFDEAGTRGSVELRTFRPGGSFTVGPFRIRTVRMTHSVPEPVSLAIGTAAGTVFHTGDWKFDPEPLIGQPTDFGALREIGDAGVLGLLADSTNAHKDTPTTSEGDVRRAFERLFATRRGRVVVCCFATNVARVASAVAAGTREGRKAALVGRSMIRTEDVARSLGLLDGVPEFLADVSHLRGLDRAESLVVCTGTQGEERAALARMARGDDRLPRLEYGDTVVVSARVIPGNEEAVDAVLSRLRARGVEVLTGADTVDGLPLHVSGHPGRGELRTLYGLLRPRFAVPVHGTIEHLEQHARLARACCVERAIVCEECEVIRLSEHGTCVLGRVEVPLMNVMKQETRRPDRRVVRRAVG